MMFHYRQLVIPLLFCLCSCEQMLRSVAEESAKATSLSDSMRFEYNEKPIAIDREEIVERKKEGEDSLYMGKNYFRTGGVYSECWFRNGQLDGLSTFYNVSGKPQYSLSYKEGKVVSLLSSFDLNGDKNDGGTLKNGNGDLKIYHPITGNLIYHAVFRNGFRNGACQSFFSDGKKSMDVTFRNDTSIGPYTEYYHSGQISEKGDIDLYRLSGSMASYYPDGKLKSQQKWFQGTCLLLEEYDEEARLVKERKTHEGRFIGTNFYYYNGELESKGEMLEDKKHGKFEYFYAGGKRKSVETYSHDTILSEILWYENGNMHWNNVYKAGRKNGICKEYYPTGTLRVEQMYVNGVEEGMYKSYFPEGAIYNDGQFKNGELSGDLKFYSKEGKLTQTKKYN